MRETRFIRKLSYACVAILICGTAMAGDLIRAPGRSSIVPLRDIDVPDAAPLGTNLTVDPCTGCNYDSNAGGYYVWGLNNCETPGTTQWIAVPFIASHSAAPRQILASINLDNVCVSSGTQVTLGIYSDTCAGPGTLLASGVATVPAAPCAVATARLRGAPALVAGTKYWVGATTVSPTQDGLSGIWYASNQSQIGGNVSSGGWFQFSGFVPGFQVQ